MNLYTNVFLSPKKVIHVFGGRTLVLANNTLDEGKFFKGVSVTTKRKGFTSSISIVKNSKNLDDCTVGAFIGKNIKGLDGVKFQGRTVRRGYEYNLFLCTDRGKVTDGNIIWEMTETGWKSNGHYEIQVWAEIDDKHWGWVSIRPSGLAQPYTYETEEEAKRMLDMLFPLGIYGKDCRIIPKLD